METSSPETTEGYASSPANLLHRGLRGHIKISQPHAFVVLVALWIAFVAWIFQQDNAAGRLVTTDDFHSFINKALFITGFFAVAALAISMALRESESSGKL